jgi:hypothetical protein
MGHHDDFDLDVRLGNGRSLMGVSQPQEDENVTIDTCAAPCGQDTGNTCATQCGQQTCGDICATAQC